ncbi:peroxiredoxin family protein [Xanthocytophaga agilis]|uniref:thioredoxin-dependent peroxiredoxin n=1 Tax=Xanthocytophaga agilis TaxID=3048010 RepID=A0AAE3UJ12_9BACT|nr:peroxiredoxin family protein [Xanthocytophaga agilis]MDJ1506116.1 peroxiredoxin family protein [Xanthocytophaga agilis]
MNFFIPKSLLKKEVFAFLLAVNFIVGYQIQAATRNTLLSQPSNGPADSTIAKTPTDISPLLVGESVPLISLPDAKGNMVSLKEKLREKPSILIFYRGGWCPFCNKQLAAIQKIEGELRKMGYQIIAISTDSPENLTKTMDKERLTYTLLSDSEITLSKQFGIAYTGPTSYGTLLLEGSNGKNKDKLLPVPSVFIVDTNGIIQFEYINPDFKQRINPDILQSVAGAIMKANKSKS